MSKIDEKKLKLLIHKIGLKYNLSDSIIKNIVESPYEFTYNTIKDLKLTGDETKEEFEELKTHFLYKGFGKLYIDYNLFERKQKQSKNITKINKNKWKK